MSDQLELVPRRTPRARKLPSWAQVDPIAQVRIDSPLPHLDRIFDYAIPEAMADDVKPGVRVRVRFSGRLINGVVVGRIASSEAANVRALERVLSSEPVLTAETTALVTAVAERFAGTFSDVFRSAVPPRHARAEAAASTRTPMIAELTDDDWATWDRYTHGRALLTRASEGRLADVRGVWSAAPAKPWTADVAALVRAVLSQAAGGVLVVVPDAWDVKQLCNATEELVLSRAVLSAELGPERRYREFCSVLRGESRFVVGTRTAVFAPVADLRLIIVWDDADDSCWEPQAPYWNVRDVAALRSQLTDCALLVGAPSRSTETQLWCDSGWARPLEPERSWLRAHAPIVRAIDSADEARDPAAASARIPHTAWSVAKEGLRTGPVLIQVPRRGYLPALACQQCRESALCSCGGPLSLRSKTSTPQCLWCGKLTGSWSCPNCHGTQLRASSTGVERTAEEFGRAFPGASIIWSSSEQLHRGVPDTPALVVATPGAEPLAKGGYAAVVLLDARAQLQRTGLRSGEEAVRRWFGAALLARPKAHLIVTADHALTAVQSLVRWDSGWFAQRELADRRATGLPPESRAAVLTGENSAISEVLAELQKRVAIRVLGPSDGRGIALADRKDSAQLSAHLHAITVTRSAKAEAGVVHVHLDPREL
ncbi:MAG: primosome assembly protein PriA [Actinomycetota bacterium]|nr:primosome assembly protein PriA [Actinomycetota bacterium]MDP2288942.1 primosome assembly protein PriA [Actinomycetota bacterium]